MVRFTDKGAFRAASALLLAGWTVGVQEPAAWAQEPGQNPEERTESELPASPDGRAAGITPGAIRLEDVVVTATRSARPVSSIPGSVQVVTRKEIEDQLSLSSNPADLLAKYVPGYSANNENISGASENFRGRNVQVLVDGVPRNTPLRDVSRIISLIDLHQIERDPVLPGRPTDQAAERRQLFPLPCGRTPSHCLRGTRVRAERVLGVLQTGSILAASARL